MNKAVIKHIEFWVSNLKYSIRFYEGVFNGLGWKKIEFNAFSNGQTKIYFVQQKVKAQKTIGPRHICFLVGSRKVVDEVGRFLIKSKGDIIRGPMKLKYKNRSSYGIDFRDPDGYVIEAATRSI
ncbi:MAG: VOC family protein [Candidatus Komeilibacteria bacterium]|nr:VOC family protein [Candidatus Komeilibacteria bacterium]